jgi:hypothetical protein
MQTINTYIDNCLIHEYGKPNRELCEYELDLDDLPDHEVSNFLHILMQEDTSVRDFVRHQMQSLIEKRLSEVEV